MKKIFKMMFAVVAGAAALTACTNEPEEGITPDAGQGFTIKAQLGENTKATLIDGESIKWEDQDEVTAWYANSENEFGFDLREAAKATVSEDGHSATLNYTTIPVGSTLWLAYGSNTGYDGCSARKVEFNYTSNQTQVAAGTMNKEYLRLVGEQTTVTTAEGEYTANMNIVGTIMRYLIYSAEGTYAEEKVQKVELISSDKALAGGGAAIAYNFADYKDTENGFKYWANPEGTAFSDECTIFWDATSKGITTTLGTPMSLSATDAASSKGIYMTVPALSIGGYKYIVTTDVAIYTFDASTTPVVFANNTLKNVKLDVEKATSRIELSSIKGELQYIGDLNAAAQLISYEGVTDKDSGYWYAQTKDMGSDAWVTKEGAANAHYYTGVTFECIDNATGQEADWLTISYRTDGNTHWFMTVEPNESAEQRSATVTATFPDVDGYIVTEACKTKSVTVTQQGFTTTKTLGFGGGVGDQVISGAGVNKQSLGWCVISVNGIYAESWGDNKNNEQELYGNVVIECRDGGAAAPIVDWLTVEYGKDADGKFNSTHLQATASENNTGAERRALVCCTYNAPEGYEFEGGAKSAFRQFFVTQPANSGVKVIEFWGGIGAEYTHDANAQQAWGLSYWAINVDGATATDWGGDTRNEQLLYGSAEFKCYDYTNGVRGEEIDWVTVDYKKENGKVIDTWWLADIQANTGEARAAEIVCTWPELEGYAYKNNQNVKSTIIRQEGVTTGGGEEGGDDEPVEPGEDVYAYNVEPIPAWGSGWGFPANTVHEGNYAFIRNVTKNGEAIFFDGVNVVANPGEVAAEIVGMAFVSSAPTEEEKAKFNMQGKTASATAITARARWYGGVQIDVAFTTTDANSITKVTGYAADGTELGYWIIWTD